ncbi:ATP-binding cassette domain-containing protein [Humibacter ginsenosidimutans]|uniref:ATP-binding cassette domain-containing protein n=1 Tax=Humibacter ginsenosidimutans TaxID=2599293 RepID=UPI001FF062B0|nr:ATP-binding cassette domain-containing protein [Humibacter ginsenosidimutans]
MFGSLTVAENLRLAERGDAPGVEAVRELFPDLVARAKQRAGTLSGGQQQMVSLARALLNDNRLLLVDEPTKGLSPRVVGEVTHALEVAAASVPVLLVEQNLQVVRRLAQAVVVMENGRVVLTAPAAQFLDDRALVERYLGVGAEAPTQKQTVVNEDREVTA